MQSQNYQFLRQRWVKKHKNLQKTLIKKHKNSFEWLSRNTKQLAVGSLGSLVLLTSPIQKSTTPAQVPQNQVSEEVVDRAFVISDLSSILPNTVRPLTSQEEEEIGQILSKKYGMKVSAQLSGLRLNRSYGLIGAEQHLARYPGDNMSSHFDGNRQEASAYYSSGMAPGLGAWGYFTTSRANMTQQDVAQEKYYIAVQTFLAPQFNQRIAQYRDFFKFRKMLVVNPQNGRAMVAVIGDAGPAEWTGKHLGGSPEVMKYLERVDGGGVGPVLYFFIDDPNDTIPLGPVDPI
ncbi:MAG: hypothetical protein HYW63_03270 [Candidatus Levybacteria bacterium]|nr:hypothetical protein [Candidatus Levybacteria bacterium]